MNLVRFFRESESDKARHFGGSRELHGSSESVCLRPRQIEIAVLREKRSSKDFGEKK
jgi:hypothetical protein